MMSNETNDRRRDVANIIRNHASSIRRGGMQCGVLIGPAAPDVATLPDETIEGTIERHARWIDALALGYENGDIGVVQIDVLRGVVRCHARPTLGGGFDIKIEEWGGPLVSAWPENETMIIGWWYESHHVSSLNARAYELTIRVPLRWSDLPFVWDFRACVRAANDKIIAHAAAYGRAPELMMGSGPASHGPVSTTEPEVREWVGARKVTL